jgi:glycolate oxidase
MSLPEHVYRALEDVVGPENVSGDSIITHTYSYMWLVDTFAPDRRRPDAVVLPGSTEDVQAIIRIANRFKVRFIPIGTMLLPTCIPTQPQTIIIDPKKMNRILEIDEKNMFAVVEPYVTYAQLQAETMKAGLTLVTPRAGSQVSVLANNLFQGMGGTSHKHGYNRGILGVEWVLGSGEILKLGSAGFPGAGWFWGNGPGLNLRGLLRGECGHAGGLGMVTQMGVKLHPLPCPKTFPCSGTTPHLKAELPPDRFKLYFVKFPTYEKLIDAMYEIGRAEIGATLHKEPPINFPKLGTVSKEEFWKQWDTGFFQKEARYLLDVCLVGFSSQRQLAYEEKVLKQIIEESGGELASERLYEMGDGYTGDLFRAATTTRGFRPTGCFFVVGFAFDSLDHSMKFGKAVTDRRKEYIDRGSFMDDAASDWILSFDQGHWAECESLFFYEVGNLEANRAASEYYGRSAGENIEKGLMATWPVGPLHDSVGPAYSNYHTLLRNIKNLLDPNNVANPPYPIPAEPMGEPEDGHAVKEDAKDG